MSTGRLTDRQKRLVDEYLICLNKTKAAIRAGYSEKTADRIAQKTLNLPKVQEYLQKRQKELADKTGITQEWVLEELRKVAAANGADFARVAGGGQRVELVDTDTLPPDKLAAIAAVEETKFGIKVSTYDKVRALELLGKHLGLFDGKGGQGQGTSNNLFETIQDSTGEDVDLSDLPEIQQTTAPRPDMVEPADTETP